METKPRIFIVGDFLGSLNHKKYKFFLEGAHYRKHYNKLYVLSAGRLSCHLKDGEFVSYPAWLREVEFRLDLFTSGIFRWFFLWLREPVFCKELWISELDAYSHYLDRKLTTRLLKRIPYYGRLVSSLAYINKVFADLKIGPRDTVILWSEHMPGRRLIKRHAQQVGATLLLSEYGELPGTCFVCSEGMFHESWPAKNRNIFVSAPVSENDIRETSIVIDALVQNRASNKSQLYSAEIASEFSLPDNGEPVLYINGSQPQASGLMPACSRFSREFSPHFRSNKEAVHYFDDLANKYKWRILYKDHPNTHRGFPHSVISGNDFSERVQVLDDVDIYDALPHCALMVSLGSKSVFISLLLGVPVLLLGPYSIHPNDLEAGYYEFSGEDSVLAALQLALAKGVDGSGLREFLTRMAKYYYYNMGTNNQSLFERGSERFWYDLNEYLSGKRSSISSNLFLIDK